MEKNMDVVALGELLIDFTDSGMSSQNNPVMEANPGGAPCNVLAMLKKLNHSVAFIGKIGVDIFGSQLKEALDEVGIDRRGLVEDKDIRTTLAFVKTLAGGDREFSFYRNPGADMMLKETELDEALIKSARIFHFGTLSMTHEECRKATKKAIAVAKEAGCLISFDPNIREPLWDDLEVMREQILYGMGQCDVLKISDNEITWLTGTESYEEGVKWIRDRFDISLILVSLGPDGSMAYSKSASAIVKPFLNKNTIETTGAGDTFCASVLHYVLENGLGKACEENLGNSDTSEGGSVKVKNFDQSELTEMLTFANAAASIVTTRKGALRVMPEKEEVIEFIGGYEK